MNKYTNIYIFTFLLTVLLAVAFLAIGACLPQRYVLNNVKESAAMLGAEGDYPKIADRTDASILDNYTDSLILIHSCETNSSDFSTILTNPSFKLGGQRVDDLSQYLVDDTPDINRYYVRYWMGFRTPMRLLLCVFNYLQIRRYLTFTLYTLFAMVICSIAKWAGEKPAFLFALSMIMVRLHIVSQSLQYSTCFLLAFLAMLLVPVLYQHKKYETVFFMELGMLTMYFDFYTTPILTFGLPMIYICAICVNHGHEIKAKRILKNAVGWLTGYVLMWVAKLVLTTLLTDVNAIENGFTSFAGRIGIIKVSGLEDRYNPLLALKGIVDMLTAYPENSGKKVAAVALCVFSLGVLGKFLWNRQPLHTLYRHAAILLIAVFPVIWYAVAAQPTVIHSFFQYRGIAVSLWAVMMYILLTLQKEKDVSRP